VQIRVYGRQWHRILLTKVSSGVSNPATYEAFYTALSHGRGKIDTSWMQSKRSLGQALLSTIISPWELEHGRSPRILALCAGLGIVEGVWVEHGYNVTFHDCQEVSLQQVRASYPGAKTLMGDLRSFEIPAGFDLIIIVASDYLLDLAELEHLMRSAAGVLGPAGQLVVSSVCVISLLKVIKETVKTVIGWYRSPDWVFWGWWRTPAVFHRCAEKTGLRLACTSCATFVPPGKWLMKPRLAAAAMWPALACGDMVFCYSRK
jgi:hypothetical protein